MTALLVMTLVGPLIVRLGAGPFIELVHLLVDGEWSLDMEVGCKYMIIGSCRPK